MPGPGDVNPGGAGGAGAEVTGNLTVTPGQTLQVNVGGQGGGGATPTTPGAPGNGGVGVNFNGDNGQSGVLGTGGTGGNASINAGGGGGGGGGATADVAFSGGGGGGGGSSAGPVGSTFTTGANTANGHVTITYSMSGGCTRTIGYWSDHAAATTALLPITLGIPGGSDSIVVTTFAQASKYLPPNFNGNASNGINQLYAQLLAAKLNIKNGANPSAVAGTISGADAFLATHGANDWSTLTAAQRATVRRRATTPDDYNQGVTGPGHCDDSSTY
ncbi:hypothetical protein [Streptomyces sp. NPDC001135]